MPTQQPSEPEEALLITDDLPEGWRLVRALGPRSVEVDRVLDYEEWIDNAGLDRHLRSEHSNLDDGRWYLVQHTASGMRVLLRLQRQRQVRVYERRRDEVRISGIVFLPFFAGDSVASPQLRSLPTAKIEAAINRRLFWSSDAASPDEPGFATIPTEEVMQPIAGLSRRPDFYARVALQFNELIRQGETNPSARMAEHNGVPLATAQGWVARARARGLLPPGRRGRAG